MSDKLKLELCLLDKVFTIACSSEQVDQFEKASSFLSDKLLKITAKNKGLDFDKALTMVSLNLVHELLQERQHNFENAENLQSLSDRLDSILNILDLDK